MLFGVEYKSIEIERLQNAIAYFFTELENGNTTFDENLFPVAFRPFLYVRKNTANGFKVYVRKYFEPIQTSFFALATAEKISVISAFKESNKIEEICSNTANPILFTSLPVSFRAAIKSLLNLYEELSEIIEREADIEAFKTINGSLCSTCGTSTVSHLDHYLPKGSDNPLYVLSAVNPKNLISSCTTCNQGKSSKLIIFDNDKSNGARVKVFSPYENFQTWEYINIKLKCVKKPSALAPGDWTVAISFNRKLNSTLVSKINRWKNFYKIEQRFVKELRININIWVKSFEQAKNNKHETLATYIANIQPTQLSVIQIPNIILQSKFFLYLNENKRIRDKFLPTVSTAQNPSDLLHLTGVA